MNKKSRTYNTLISTITGIVGYIITYGLSFLYRTIFIYSLGKEYLGVQGLFSNILSMLSLAEMGISTAITFSLYTPIANNDIEKIKSLLRYFKRAYRIVIGVITIISVCLIPFIPAMVAEKPDIVEPLWFLYVLYVADILASYMLVYKQALIRADQKVYIISLVTNISNVIRTLIQIVILITTKQFALTLLVQIFSVIVSNVVLSLIADKNYPYLKNKHAEKLDITTHNDISLKIRSMFLYKIGAFIVHGTDNILISKFVGLASVGIYSNYTLLTGVVRNITDYFIKAVTPSVGNYTATKSVEDNHSNFEEINFLLFWVYSFCACMFMGCLSPFIKIWIGDSYVLPVIIVCFIVLNFYLEGMHGVQLIYRNVLGLYTYCKWKPLVEAVINIVASLLFLNYLGFVGVFIGTTCSFVLTTLWVEPYVLYKHYFKKSPKHYYMNYIIYLCFTIAVALLARYIGSIISLKGVVKLFAVAMLSAVLHTLLIFLTFRNTEAFQKCLIRFKTIVHKRK